MDEIIEGLTVTRDELALMANVRRGGKIRPAMSLHGALVRKAAVRETATGLAKRLGVSRMTVNNWIAARRRVPESVMELIRRDYGTRSPDNGY